MAFARTVVDEKSVSAILDAEIARDASVEDVIDSLKWLIARKPDSGYLIGGSNPPRYVIKSKPYPAFPTILRLLYTWDDNEVNVLDASFERPAAELKLAQ